MALFIIRTRCTDAAAERCDRSNCTPANMPSRVVRQAGARATAARGATVARRLEVHAGHGLNYRNVAVVAITITELNIGHAIIAQAVFEGPPRRCKMRANATCAPMIYRRRCRLRERSPPLVKISCGACCSGRARAARAHQAARAPPGGALRRQGGRRQGHGHRVCARCVDPRRGHRAG